MLGSEVCLGLDLTVIKVVTARNEALTELEAAVKIKPISN
jgi:hypothetical protein